MDRPSQYGLVPGCDPGTWPRVLPPSSRLALLRGVEGADSEFGEAVALLRACEIADVQRLVTMAVAHAVADVDVEVHMIASRYGWDLATIESLPDIRRARLATLAGSGT